ncbi:MAG: hypothetical protein K2F65_02955, partial [Eubacterium sp.]|nr:hypothetical protein [Eubacterium sp.]
IVFLILVIFVSLAIALTSVAGLIYSKNYFRYEKDTAENMASRTLCVDYCFENDNLHAVHSSDIEKMNQILVQQFPGRNISVLPIYSISSGVYMNDKPVNLFAFPKEYGSFFGLDKMQDDIAYFYNEEKSKAEFQICVTKFVDNGYESDKLDSITFEAKNGISKKSLVSVIEGKMLPSTRENSMCFVTMESFYKIVSIMFETEVKSEIELDEYSALVPIEGIYICSDKLSAVNSISSVLVQQNYNAYAPIDTFGDFEEAISYIFIVFILSSVALVFLSFVNIFITIKTAKRVKGVLFYKK